MKDEYITVPIMCINDSIITQIYKLHTKLEKSKNSEYPTINEIISIKQKTTDNEAPAVMLNIEI
jgi:hypothetical protein